MRQGQNLEAIGHPFPRRFWPIVERNVNSQIQLKYIAPQSNLKLIPETENEEHNTATKWLM